MKIKKIWVICLVVCLGGPIGASGNLPGKVIGGVLAGLGGMGMIISGGSMEDTNYENYCPVGTLKAVFATYDCNYQTCALWVSNGQTYYCHNYYSGDTDGYLESCHWQDNGSTCTQWVVVPQTCNTYACQNSNGTFVNFLKRQEQPRYDNFKYALIATSAVTGAGILTIILSMFFPRTLPASHQPSV